MGTLTLSITENINVSSGGYEFNYTTSGTSDDFEYDWSNYEGYECHHGDGQCVQDSDCAEGTYCGYNNCRFANYADLSVYTNNFENYDFKKENSARESCISSGKLSVIMLHP